MKPKAPVTIQDISDDDDEDKTAGDDGNEKKEEDYDQNMIISLSLGSSDEEYDADKTVCEVNKAHRTLERGGNKTQPIFVYVFFFFFFFCSKSLFMFSSK